MDVALERVPVQLRILYVVSDVDRAEVADVVRKQRLFAAGIRRLVLPDVRHRIIAIRFINEEATRLARSPGAVDHLVPDGARVELAGNLPSAGVDQVIARTSFYRRHELIRDCNGNIEVRH